MRGPAADATDAMIHASTISEAARRRCVPRRIQLSIWPVPIPQSVKKIGSAG